MFYCFHFKGCIVSIFGVPPWIPESNILILHHLSGTSWNSYTWGALASISKLPNKMCPKQKYHKYRHALGRHKENYTQNPFYPALIWNRVHLKRPLCRLMINILVILLNQMKQFTCVDCCKCALSFFNLTLILFLPSSGKKGFMPIAWCIILKLPNLITYVSGLEP